MKRDRLLELAGFRYIANHHSREIHRVDRLTGRCRVERMTWAGYCTRWKARRLSRSGKYNGCRYCNREEDRG